MRYLKAFLLGTLAAASLAGVALAAVSAAAMSGTVDDLRIELGPVLFLDIESTDAGTESTAGPAVGLVAVAGGLLNASAMALLARRRSAVKGNER
ncbi:MAG: hypothetical protein FJW96_15640 [Actinobacteria bacterium]|nr:hypothetical protein [Actinomycetota bacterium]